MANQVGFNLNLCEKIEFKRVEQKTNKNIKGMGNRKLEIMTEIGE